MNDIFPHFMYQHLAQQGLTPAARGRVVTPCIHAKLTALQCILQCYLLLALLAIKFPIQMYRAAHLNRDRNPRLLNKIHDFYKITRGLVLSCKSMALTSGPLVVRRWLCEGGGCTNTMANHISYHMQSQITFDIV